MVDDIKKQMHRFEQLIGFKGKINVTSRESMEGLIDALVSKYKSDIWKSVRLHRLEFLYDLVEYGRKRRTETESEGLPLGEEMISVDAKDVDDWKDLMTLSRIYYVLEHPRSEGIRRKRRLTKKKIIKEFTNEDLIEWRVSQNFRLRGLEEWRQRRSDARKLASWLEDESESEEEVDELFQLFDDSSHTKRKKKVKKAHHRKEKKPSSKRPFKFSGDSIEDWTESYSEDSEYSDVEEFAEEIEDFPEDLERKIGAFEETRSPPLDEEEGDISYKDLFHTIPEYHPYRNPIFWEMDEVKTIEEWYELYNQVRVIEEEEEEEEEEHAEEVVEVEPLMSVIEEGEEVEEELPKVEPSTGIIEEGEAEKILEDNHTDIIRDDKEYEGKMKEESSAAETFADTAEETEPQLAAESLGDIIEGESVSHSHLGATEGNELQVDAIEKLEEEPIKFGTDAGTVEKDSEEKETLLAAEDIPTTSEQQSSKEHAGSTITGNAINDKKACRKCSVNVITRDAQSAEPSGDETDAGESREKSEKIPESLEEQQAEEIADEESTSETTSTSTDEERDQKEREE